jgi:hypothetical protein
MEMLEHAGFVAQDVEGKYGDIPPCVPMVRPKKQGKTTERVLVIGEECVVVWVEIY